MMLSYGTGTKNCRTRTRTAKLILRPIDVENIQESRIQAITEQSSIKFKEVFGTKYKTSMKKSQNTVFCPENLPKFYRTLFSNRLYQRLLKFHKIYVSLTIIRRFGVFKVLRVVNTSKHVILQPKNSWRHLQIKSEPVQPEMVSIQHKILKHQYP